ncbi:MAG: TIGR01244 family sulfur transferase [Rhodobacterales bacterium]|nr:TIGR01244 family sulfur transferase [Rhodobacterales bacterium]
MDIRQITPAYSVSPQIEPEDIPEIVAAGFATLIDNRPDAEIPMELSSYVMRAAAEAAGLKFVVLPVTHQTMTPELVAAQMDALAASDGPVLAYCASGTRCSVVWSLGQAGRLQTDEIMTATARAGYDLSHLRPRLDAMAQS